MPTALDVSPAITTLDRLSSTDEGRSGAKAFNCARLLQAGFRVPGGLVVRADASEADIAVIAEHPWLDAVPAGTRFAVRSSGIGEDGAGESFAGIHQTLLDVRREDLAAAIASCRASGRGEAALEYRRAKGLTLDGIAMGVLVQQMVQPLVAGVGFTTNPMNGSRDELVINASWGLGEALVSGQVDPDEFVVRKGDGELLWSRLGDKGRPDASPEASLNPSQLRELARVLVAIEQHYGTPQDVEWCHDGTELWIVQSRPITTAAATHSHETEWTRANLAEVLPDLTAPQALVAFEDLLNRSEAQYLGGLMGDATQLGPIVKSFHGRLHFNLSHLRYTCTLSGVSPAVMLRSMGHSESIRPEDERLPKPSLAMLARAGDFARIVWQHKRVASIIERHEVRSRDYLRRFAEPDLRTMPDQEIWNVLKQWMDDAPDFMQPVLLLGNVGMHEAPLQQICQKVGTSFEGLLYPQLATGTRSVSAQQAFDLVALAGVARREPAAAAYIRSGATDLDRLRTVLKGTTFLERFERFLRLYGHRGLYEYDWSLPRYSEDPSPLIHAIRAHLDGPEPAGDSVDARDRAAARAWTEFEARLTPWQRFTLLGKARKLARTIKRYYVWREQVRSDLVKVLAAARRWHLVLAERFVERGWIATRDDYFMLHLDEVGDVIEGRAHATGLQPIVSDRLATRERQRAIHMPLLMRESELPSLIRTAAILGEGDDGQLIGHPVSRGCVEADVVVVRDPSDFARMKRGAILVAPATDPSWTPLFTLASGVIVEIGGVLSHASTIAREYGLPAIANVRHATKRLRTGDRVRLDAVNGVVERLT